MELTGRVHSPRATSPDPRRVTLLGGLGIATAIVGLTVPWVGPVRLGISGASLVVSIAAGLVLLTAGLIAWVRQPRNPIWRLMLANYFAAFIWEVSFIPLPVAWTAALVFRNVGSAIFAHLSLAFPGGYLRSRGERWLVGFIYVVAVGAPLAHALVWAPSFACNPPCPWAVNVLAVWPNNELAEAISNVTSSFVPIIGIVVVVLVWRHWRAANVPTRRTLLPVALALPVAALTNSIGYPADAFHIEVISDLVRSPLWLLSGFIFPVAFLLAVLRLRMTTSAVAGAVLELGALPTLKRLEQILQGRLGDRDLRVLRWSSTQAAFIDQDGRAVQPPGPGEERALLVIDRDGVPVAAIDHDAALLDDAGLAGTVSSAARIALDATDLRDELRARGGSTGGLPTGEVTFVFGDVEGSTSLLEQLGQRYADLLTEIRLVASEVADQQGGRMVDALGDEVFLAFSASNNAVAAAIELARRMAATQWPEGRTVRLRIGVHSGRPDLTRSGYVGLDVHRAARVMAAGHGGQILATMAVAATIKGDSGIILRPLGRFALRGLSEPTPIFQLEAPGLRSEFPPLRAEPAT